MVWWLFLNVGRWDADVSVLFFTFLMCQFWLQVGLICGKFRDMPSEKKSVQKHWEIITLKFIQRRAVWDDGKCHVENCYSWLWSHEHWRSKELQADAMKLSSWCGEATVGKNSPAQDPLIRSPETNSPWPLCVIILMINSSSDSPRNGQQSTFKKK